MTVQSILCRLASLLFCVLSALPASAGVSATDAAGRAVTLPRPAMRIVTLAPSVTELVYAAGAGARVVGTVEYSDYPPAARRLPRVGSLTGLSLEAILRLRPDLVVVWKDGTSPQLLARLQQYRVPVFVSRPTGLDDVAREMLALGQLAGTETTATAAAARYRARIDAVRTRYRGRRPVTVFYQVSAAPLFTVSDRSFLGGVLQLCGGRNVFGALPLPAPQVSREAVVAARPQVMLAASRQELSQWDDWRSVPAVARDARYAIDTNLASRPGPRLADAAETICATLDRGRHALGLTPR